MHDKTTSTEQHSVYLSELAAKVLPALERIADTAAAGLGRSSSGLGAMASINQATAEKVAETFRSIREGRELDCIKLMSEPAIARLVIADDDDNREEIYISRAGTVDPVPIKLCSYLSPKGELASYSVGDYRPVRLPSGIKNYELIEKATFSPGVTAGNWDSRPAIVFAHSGPPFTIRSLRDLLARAGFAEDEVDELERLLAEQDALDNVVAGLQRSALTAMQMRVQPLLDQYQSEIFRLPLDSRLAILGPPGSGKTTTLIKRLRQKLDFAFLEPEEKALVENPAASRLDHAHSWLMFTPTVLLKEYVKAALSKEDVPVTSDRIQTWEDYRQVVARNTIPILRTSSRKGMVIKPGPGIVRPETLVDQIGWFEDFTEFQHAHFVQGVRTEAERLVVAEEDRTGAVGRQILAAVERNADRPILLLSELAALLDELQLLSDTSRNQTRDGLRRVLALEVRRDRGLLDDLARFVESLKPEPEDELDEVDADDEEDEDVSPQGRRAAEAAFIRALRAKAVAEASRRPPARTSRNAQILTWLDERGVGLPELAEQGTRILIERAMTRISKAPSDFVAKVPARYRRFRRERFDDGRWYSAVRSTADADALEIDLILLAMLRAARQLRGNALLMRRLGSKIPAILDGVAFLQRNQILVDEATDFSPIQLAAMAALADPRTESFFAIGDFNQRLTKWGSRSKAELEWLYPDLDVREVGIVYRQSRKLNDFASKLTVTGDHGTDVQFPQFMENEGVPPVLGLELSDRERLATWLAQRIGEVERFSQQLPSIAVLVNHEIDIQPLADALNEALINQSIRAIACPKGQAIGPENEVRVFEMQHIKGLEFEVIFLVDIDKLAEEEPDLFERYIYVGATRAATYLGFTCAGASLPRSIEAIGEEMCASW